MLYHKIREQTKINYKLPSVPDNKMWMAIVDTSEENGVPQRYSNAGGLESWVAPNSIKVLRRLELKTVSLYLKALSTFVIVIAVTLIISFIGKRNKS